MRRLLRAMIVDVPTVRASKIILASGSPRRVEILNALLGLGAVVVPSTFPEDLDKSKFTPGEYVQENARCKASEVYAKLRAEQGHAPSLVIGADTVVVSDGRILEKPADEEAAVAMLKSLSGSEHQVMTGVALFYAPQGDETEPRVELFVEATTVCFAELPEEVIRAYVETGEPFDKAGGYGYQSKAAPFVTGIRGCYWNVRGVRRHFGRARARAASHSHAASRLVRRRRSWAFPRTASATASTSVACAYGSRPTVPTRRRRTAGWHPRASARRRVTNDDVWRN